MSADLVLRPVGLSWIQGVDDDPSDLCAHGDYEFRIRGTTFCEGSGGRSLTLSAAAIYLMRTLERSHTKVDRPDGPLFPCCGFSFIEPRADGDVVMVGCPSGDDFEVVHRKDEREVVLRSPDGVEEVVDEAEWRAAVFGFADQVSALYATSSAKVPHPDDADGFRCFQKEWQRRRGLAFPRGIEPSGPERGALEPSSR